MNQTKAYATKSASSDLAATEIPRRMPTEKDVQIEILFCGVCHSDLHQARDEWSEAMPTVYPCVPGHEIVGRVTAVGSSVKNHEIGDIVGVGCLVDSDQSCPHCQEDLEQRCAGAVMTYNSPDKHGAAPVTYGGYSTDIVVDEHFVLKVPKNLDLAGVAPLLCAGITTYSPLRAVGVKKGMKVGIVGLGGLGHMGVKFSRAFGAHTVVFTTSPGKADDAKRLGADEVVISKNEDEMKAQMGSFDFILDTVSADHDIAAYLNLLKHGGTLTLVGVPEKPLQIPAFTLIGGQRKLTGSMIGGIAETQEMLDFCGEHNITSDVEVIAMKEINKAYDRLLSSDVKYRFSIDMDTLRNE